MTSPLTPPQPGTEVNWQGRESACHLVLAAPYSRPVPLTLGHLSRSETLCL